MNHSTRVLLLLFISLSVPNSLFVFCQSENENESDSFSSSSSLSPTSIDQIDATSTISTDPTESATPVVLPDDPNFSWPMPYDTSISSNFSTVSCQSLFEEISKGTADGQVIKQCHPISFLLPRSTAFFDALDSKNLVSAMMQDICSIDKNECDAQMGSLLSSFDKRCKQELKQQNPYVQNGRNSILSFSTIYDATCSTNNNGDNCLVHGVFNETNILPLIYAGIGQDWATNASCSTCSSKIMNIYSEYSSNDTLPIAETYSNLYSIEVGACGENFAAKPHDNSSGHGLQSSFLTITIAIISTLLILIHSLQ